MAAEENTPERWLPVVGYEGRYEVSSSGRVRSVGRTVSHSRPGCTSFRVRRKMSIHSTSKGRQRIALRGDGGKVAKYFVHRLVLCAFVRQPLPGEECDHIDFDPSNNRLENLRWIAHVENVRHSDAHGRRNTPRGEIHCRAKLTETTVREIRSRRAAGELQPALAERFGVTSSVISEVISRKAWKHVE